MTFLDAIALFEYWRECPPENEMLSLLAQVYTTWKPLSAQVLTKEQAEMEHRRSLEQRWKAGAMNAKQLFESMGGALSMDGTVGNKMTGATLPGIGPFPGT